MRQVVNAPWVVLNGVSLAIKANQHYGCYLEILEALHGQMSAFLQCRARMLVVRLDIHQRDYTPDSTAISKFMRKLKKRLRRRYRGLLVGHLWVREQKMSKAPHYHAVLLLDGRLIQHPAKVIELAQEIAEGWDWPMLYVPANCYVKVHRDDRWAYLKAFERCSYLAKVNTKQGKGKYANHYNCSRLPLAA